ncbi:hypothetical protein BGZ73_001792, partial [Actinomortierella ambigua]
MVDVDSAWYEGLMEAPSFKEFLDKVSEAPKAKAPGISGITNEFFQKQPIEG